MVKKCIIIWWWFGGLGSAILMAQEGYEVVVYEKNHNLWGRANILEKDGFRRDMGPSRYLMPDVFEKFFESIGEKVSDYLDLIKLDPSYRIWFKDIPSTSTIDTTSKPILSINFYDQASRDMIIKGIKTLETRALNPEEPKRYFGDIKVWDTIKFINKNTWERVLTLVTKKYLWKNFKELSNESDELLHQIRPDKADSNLHDTEVLKSIRNFTPDYVDKVEKDWLVWREFKVLETNACLVVDITGDVEKDSQTFESIETGAGQQLRRYLALAQEQYQIAMDKFVYKNYTSRRQLMSLDILFKTRKLRIRDTMDRYVSRFFKSSELKKIMEYTMLFLGTSPYEAPALFNIMSHVDFGLGVYYPQWGIHEIPKALVKIAKKHGVKLVTDKEVKQILIDNQKATGVEFTNGDKDTADIIISNADMRHTETKLLASQYQTYPESYWNKKVISPSAFIIYLGIQSKVPELTHHNLIFAKDRKSGYDQIFHNPQLPDDPSLYICKPSEVDPSVAPIWNENLFILVPIAPWLEFDEQQKNEYASFVIKFVEQNCHISNLSDRIISQTIFSVKDFAAAYNSYKWTALGLAHTLFQSALRRPGNISTKVKGLYYTGSYTNPGIGMPMCLISAMLVRDRIIWKKQE